MTTPTVVEPITNPTVLLPKQMTAFQVIQQAFPLINANQVRSLESLAGPNVYAEGPL